VRRIAMPQPTPLQRLLTRLRQPDARFGARYGFPQVPLALLLALGGIWLLQIDLGRQWEPILHRFVDSPHGLQPSLLPPILIGAGMVIIALGILLCSRLAWVMALALAATAAASMLFGQHRHAGWVMAYFMALLALLLTAWRRFDRSSIAASTLFALTAVMMLLTYATFGSYYLGGEFKPQIADMTTALYFAIVTMSTVGYGDITPQTPESKLFTVSVIVFGVAVFATSLTAVIAPMVTRSLQRIVNRKGSRMKRENHFVVIGNTPLAINTWRELAHRGQPVTRLLHAEPEGGLPDDVDAVFGDPNDGDVLRKAGADKAQAVMAMLEDDSDNAFVVLAVRELSGNVRTVAAVNNANHLARIRLVQPDVVIAPQILGGELAAMLMTGEKVDADFVMQRMFQRKGDAAGTGASA